MFFVSNEAPNIPISSRDKRFCITNMQKYFDKSVFADMLLLMEMVQSSDFQTEIVESCVCIERTFKCTINPKQ